MAHPLDDLIFWGTDRKHAAQLRADFDALSAYLPPEQQAALKKLLVDVGAELASNELYNRADFSGN